MLAGRPIIRLGRTSEFDPPDTPETRYYIDSWLFSIEESMHWLREDQPDTFNVVEVILTPDFVGEVRRQTGESAYQAARDEIVVAAKTIRKPEGAVIMLNLDAYPLDNPLGQRFISLHEGLHARHHRHFDLERLSCLPLPARRGRGTAETLLDEYACDRLAFQLLTERSGASLSELKEALESICLSLFTNVTSGKTALEARRLHATYNDLYDQQGGLSPRQWMALAQDVHVLTHGYWVNAIHTLAFLDHFSLAADHLQTLDHNTPAARELVALIRNHFEARNFDMEEAQSTVLVLFSEFGLTFAADAEGQEYVVPTNVCLTVQESRST